MAWKAGQLISRGPQRWLVRVSLGREAETGTRECHNRTIRGSFREAQMYLNTKLRERDIGRLLSGSDVNATRDIAAEAREQGYQALVVPSAAVAGSKNLVVFLDRLPLQPNVLSSRLIKFHEKST